MKKIVYIVSLLALIACTQPNSQKENTNESEIISTDNIENQTNKEKDTPSLGIQNDSIVEKDDFSLEDSRRESLNLSFEDATLFNLTDTMKADFNGDGAMDEAVYIRGNETSGIIIVHGKINEEVRIGFNQPFSNMTEFDWVDYWGLVKDKETSETTFTDDGDMLGIKDVKLQNPSIALGKDEVGGGLITFLNGKYVWINQTC